MSENEIKGILGTKLGMTQIFDEENRVIPVTVVEAGPCVVTQIRTKETDGYNAIQIAYGEIDPRKANKPVAGHFKKAGVTPRRHVTEIRMDDVSGYELGQDITVEIFDGVTFVDVTGTSKGKGFAGGMKRHGFAGQGAAHGNQAAHRRPGGIGAAATPGRIFKGKRMAGRMGTDRVTTQNLKVQKIDADANLLLIKGAIPGNRGGIVTVKTAVKGGAHA
ncbi:MAG TPA: 50S ribosomal protein L3 [Corynebacterium pollutisoli]|mgnify:FL=1|jgi:large subunit ribosomal protein L3|uniref:Large ribosomal subunit protein uL3 n=1 Tax=Corynebacterium pollutisoli TaxID=1610489 RepID=A0A7X8MV46_9CORY|nr:50S ribosomal protein L3 [Corynebacterium pollutisoli]HJD79582.1 50S ribosomal protein L3 [Corynebacterium pollutisoli]